MRPQQIKSNDANDGGLWFRFYPSTGADAKCIRRTSAAALSACRICFTTLSSTVSLVHFCAYFLVRSHACGKVALESSTMYGKRQGGSDIRQHKADTDLPCCGQKCWNEKERVRNREIERERKRDNYQGNLYSSRIDEWWWTKSSGQDWWALWLIEGWMGKFSAWLMYSYHNWQTITRRKDHAGTLHDEHWWENGKQFHLASYMVWKCVCIK